MCWEGWLFHLYYNSLNKLRTQTTRKDSLKGHFPALTIFLYLLPLTHCYEGAVEMSCTIRRRHTLCNVSLFFACHVELGKYICRCDL